VAGSAKRIEELVEQELASALRRARDERGGTSGHRHGCVWPLTGSFGPVERSVPRVRLHEPNGTVRKRRSAVLPNDAQRTRQMEALIASASLSGPTPRRVQRGLVALFRGAVGKDVVSRARRKVKAEWQPAGFGATAHHDADNTVWCSAKIPTRLLLTPFLRPLRNDRASPTGC
jgi:hypothetical protein